MALLRHDQRELKRRLPQAVTPNGPARQQLRSGGWRSDLAVAKSLQRQFLAAEMNITRRANRRRIVSRGPGYI